MSDTINKKRAVRSAMLVYQCGLANVFGLTGDGARKRLMQSDYRSCECFARGMAATGMPVGVHHCDEAGDIIGREWQSGAGEMFKDAKLYTANATLVYAFPVGVN